MDSVGGAVERSSGRTGRLINHEKLRREIEGLSNVRVSGGFSRVRGRSSRAVPSDMLAERLKRVFYLGRLQQYAQDGRN